jgi:hypothetical protein
MSSASIFERYGSDPAFHSLVTLLERLIEGNEGLFTTGEFRDALSVALQRTEMRRVIPLPVVSPRSGG